MDLDYLEKVFNKYIPEPNSGCWLWEGAVSWSGYGLIWYQGKQLKAHRVSYALHNIDYDANLCILHSCDTPCCVNPKHLRQGTHKDNMLDKKIRWRTNYGEKCTFSKLNKEQVWEIRELYKNNNITQKEIAKIYNVDQSLISDIINNKIWRKV